MSGHKNFKQLNDVSYLRFNFTYKPKVDPKKASTRAQDDPRLAPRLDCRLQLSKGARQKQGRRWEEKSSFTCLSACTCHMHFHFSGTFGPHFAQSQLALPALPALSALLSLLAVPAATSHQKLARKSNRKLFQFT